MADEAATTAAYMPWRTLMNTLDQLAENMPNRIDKTVFAGQSWGAKNQLMIGFRFLGFIDDAGTPQPALTSVAVRDVAVRKAALRKVFEKQYSDLFALDLMKATPSQFDEKLTESYGVSGDTRIKAKRFFLTGAQDLGIKVSALLMKDRAANGASRPVRKTRTVTKKAVPDPEPGGSQPEGTSKVILLQSGGTLTVTATVDLFAMSKADRDFVFHLIDELEQYQQPEADDEPES